MKDSLLVLMILTVSAWGASAWAVCPADTIDRGACDTIYVEPWYADTVLQGDGPYFARVPIYVTHDVADVWDSIAGFAVPLCHTHTNPSAYCSLSEYWNRTTTISTDPNVDRSCFRHLPSMDDPQVRNRMMDLNSNFMNGWDAIFINMDGGSRFWLSMVPIGSVDQRWWEGSRVLLATMTFKVEDQMEICIDTCFCPPQSHLAFVTVSEGGGWAYSYVPRPGTGDPESYEVCFNLRFRCGDANKDGVVDLADAVYLLNYVFRGGDPPDPLELGDVNNDGIVDLEDIVYLLNYLFKGGPSPCEP